MISKRQNNRLRLLQSIRKAEEKVKTVTNLPSNDPLLYEIRGWAEIIAKPRYHKKQLDELQQYMINDAISKQLAKGYSVRQISRQLNISSWWVRETAKKRGIDVMRYFNYQIKSKTGIVVYANSKEAILRYFGYHYHDVDKLTDFVSADYMITNAKFRWNEIPCGAIYIVNGDRKHEYILKIK